VWNNIDGANSSVYRINGTSDNNNQSIRCLVTNSGGSLATDPYVIVIVAAASPSSNPSSNPNGGTYVRKNSFPFLSISFLTFRAF
jgi:hypothetical protein